MKTGRRKSALKARATFPKKAQNPEGNTRTASQVVASGRTAKTSKEQLTKPSTRIVVKKTVTSPVASRRASATAEKKLVVGRVSKLVASPRGVGTAKKTQSLSVVAAGKSRARPAISGRDEVASKSARETRSKSLGAAGKGISRKATRSRSQEQSTRVGIKQSAKSETSEAADTERANTDKGKLKKATKTPKKQPSVKARGGKRKMAEVETDVTVITSEVPSEMGESSMEVASQEVQLKQEGGEPEVKKLKQVFNLTEENPTKTPGESRSPTSPKKLKGSVAVKFKSWNWTKQSVEDRQQAMEGKKAFESSDEELKEEEKEKKTEEGVVYVQQNNQKLRKCSMCLLYIPAEDFSFHQAESCEALQIGNGREYTCSECLASYSSQKLLVRHKRECPRRSQSMYRYQSPRDGKALEGLYSVVWKCHCKQSFPSSDELGKHRSKCRYAQNYTVTCPICNSRIMGGQRVLRYHMSKNHPSLFLPNETSSSCILNSLEGTSTVNQIINTKTDDIDGLVKKLTKRQGASVRVVTVPSREQQKQEGTDIPITIPINVGQATRQEIVVGNVSPAGMTKTGNVYASKLKGMDDNAASQSKKPTGTPKVVQELADMDVNVVGDTDVTPTRAEASPERKVLRKRKAEQDQEPEVTSRKEVKTSGTPVVPKPIAILTTNKDGQLDVKSGSEAFSPANQETLVRVSQRNLAKRVVTHQAATVKIERQSPSKPAPKATSTSKMEATAKSATPTTAKKPAAASVGKAEVKESPSVANDDEVRIEQLGESQEDLRNLLQKAKALTKELEEKLARTSSSTKSDEDAQPQEVLSEEEDKPQKQEVKGRAARKGREAKSTNEAATRQGARQEGKGVKPDVKTGSGKKSTPRAGRRYNQVTCLDCHKVFRDNMELGNHKRSKKCQGVQFLDLHSVPDIDVDAMDFVSNSSIKMDVGECYYCTICPSKFSLRSQLYIHMRDDHKGGLSRYLNYHCPYCPRVFQTVLQRQSHKKERHEDLIRSTTDDYNLQGVGACDKCYGVFRKEELDKHEIDCDGIVPETSIVPFCQLCGQVVENEDKLKLHRQQNHLSAIHFRCSQCTRTFGHALELRCHKVSSHSRASKMDQVYQAVKRLETRKNLKLGKSIKIHISPATPIKEPEKKSDDPELQSPPESAQESVEEVGTPATSEDLPGSGKIVSSGKGPLNLTKEQMEMLSRGESIKLVIPKSTNMKKLSFAVPSADGKTKKFSLSPKTTDGGTLLPSDLSKHLEAEALEGRKGGRASPEPQKQLAAALGLQPFDPEHPTQGTEQHRPTRLRSGRTIRSTVLSGSRKEKDESQRASGRSASESTQEEHQGAVEIVSVTEREQQTPKEDDVEIVEPQIHDAVEYVEDVEISSTQAVHFENATQVVEQNGAVPEQKVESTEGGNLPPVQVLKPVGAERVQCMRCNLVLGSMLEVANHQCMIG